MTRRPMVRGARIAGRWYVCAWGIVGEGSTMGEALRDLNARGKAWAERWYQ